MRPAPRTVHARHTLVAVSALVAAVAWVPTGCTSVGDGQQLSGRNQLVDDLTDRMTRAASLTYTATYSLAHGASATIAQAQQPARSAYSYPGGRLVLTPDQTSDCRIKGAVTTCTVSAPPLPPGDPSAALLGELGGRGLITPTLVISLLGAVALDDDPVVSQHDTTLSGEHATCLDVRGLSDAPATGFTACVTTEGLLGSFTGTVSGNALDVTLEQYGTTVASDAFALPAGARIVAGSSK
jgi:hypothetical protein